MMFVIINITNIMDIPYFWIGVVVVVFIVSIALLIFAPKSINYYKSETYPILKFIYENNLDAINADLQTIKEFKCVLDLNVDSDNSEDDLSESWLKWPNLNATKKYCIFPLFMFSKLNKPRKTICKKTYSLIKNIPDVKTCTFLMIGANSSIKKQRKWKTISNATLCCLFVLEAPMATIDDCGIWVNGEAKKLTKNSIIIFDSSKEHSLYNNTDYPLYGLLLDIKRPKNIPLGASEVSYDTEVVKFVNII